MIRYCFFDMDGTLLDSLSGIASAMNWALAQLGLPGYSVEDYRYKVGRGMDNLCRACLPEDRQEEFVALRRLYDARYTAHCCEGTEPYPGIQTSLAALQQAGVQLVILTNKPQSQADRMMTLLQPYSFACVMGKQDGFPIKPDPASLQYLMQQLGAQAEESIYIGDSDVDMRLGTNAGVATVGVTWGFRGAEELSAAGATHLCHDPAALGELILSL